MAGPSLGLASPAATNAHLDASQGGGRGCGAGMPTKSWGILKTHLFGFLSQLRGSVGPGLSGVLSSPHKLGLGQLLSAVLLHGLGLQLGDAGVFGTGTEDLGGVGLLSPLSGGWVLVLLGFSVCREKEAEGQPLGLRHRCAEPKTLKLVQREGVSALLEPK